MAMRNLRFLRRFSHLFGRRVGLVLNYRNCETLADNEGDTVVKWLERKYPEVKSPKLHCLSLKAAVRFGFVAHVCARKLEAPEHGDTDKKMVSRIRARTATVLLKTADKYVDFGFKMVRAGGGFCHSYKYFKISLEIINFLIEHYATELKGKDLRIRSNILMNLARGAFVEAWPTEPVQDHAFIANSWSCARAEMKKDKRWKTLLRELTEKIDYHRSLEEELLEIVPAIIPEFVAKLPVDGFLGDTIDIPWTELLQYAQN